MIIKQLGIIIILKVFQVMKKLNLTLKLISLGKIMIIVIIKKNSMIIFHYHEMTKILIDLRNTI
jgi:hypothetical protein